MLPWKPHSIPFSVAYVVAATVVLLLCRKWALRKYNWFLVTHNFLAKWVPFGSEDSSARELLKFSIQRMNLGSTQLVATRQMGVYEPISPMWGELRGANFLDISLPEMILQVETNQQLEDPTVEPFSHNHDQETSKPATSKTLKRLAQNREAARKSRQRKKVYVQQLENSKLKLIQLEQELDRVRQQGLHVSPSLDSNRITYPRMINPGIVTFEKSYSGWVEEQSRKISVLRNALALNSHIADMELKVHVDTGIRHYLELFTMKAIAAKADVFYVMSGLWKTPVERFFLWIGGSRPSELLKILIPHLEPLTEQQHLEVGNLRQLCQQAEDALSQGMEKLNCILAEAIAAHSLGQGNYLSQMGAVMEKMEALARFVDQADHLRKETLLQVSRLLTTRQAARGLLAMGEYSQRLRALSSRWSSRLDGSPV